MDAVFLEPLSKHIWELKYRYRFDGRIIDHNIEDSWHRTAMAVASVEKHNKEEWAKQFFSLLEGFQFLPGGRILAGAGAGAGTQKKVTLFNCFVMGTLDDSIVGIFQALKESAITMQQGGGIGIDFSTLRPRGTLAIASGRFASGPLSFMEMWEAMSTTMSALGERRGAMMGVLRCDHPDIEAFVQAKRSSSAFKHFNLSVLITDEFVKAIADDAEWPLVFPINGVTQLEHTSGKNFPGFGESNKEYVLKQWPGRDTAVPCKVFRLISARQLWQQLAAAAGRDSEPGVLFIDQINRFNNLYYCEHISTTNPCGEIPLPAYGACNLGSLNLTQFIRAPFSRHAQLDWHGLTEATALAVRFLDNVIDLSRYPLPQQETMAKATRRIGLGLTGLADMFVMLGIVFGSNESIVLVDKLMKTIAHTSWHTSVELAKEKGSFPYLKKKSFLKAAFVEKLPVEICQKIERYGIRNSHHNAIAPTGTISLLANNISSGLEPMFAPRYKRSVYHHDGLTSEYLVNNYAYRLWLNDHSEQEPLPEYFISAENLSVEAQLKIQAKIQEHVDNAISKTIQLQAGSATEKVAEIYNQAYTFKLKGCTVFSPETERGQIISKCL